MKTIDIVTNRILEALNENTIPWEKPWSGVNGSNLPLKLSEGTPYTGSNSFLLGIQCRPSRTWGTLKQWVQKGERVKYDEFKKATPIIYFSEAKSKTLKENGERDTYKLMKFYNVYNESQLESWNGVSKYDPKVEPLTTSFNPIDQAEKFIANNPMSMLRVEHGGDRAFYSPKLDYISMPKRESFNNANAYYATLLHELGHASGHESRLNRKGIANFDHFGSHQYSEEELTAEIYANTQANMLGISTESIDRNTVAYCQDWIKVLKNNPEFIIKASRQAMKIIDYMNKND